MRRVSEPEFPSVVGRWPCEVQWGDCDPAGIIFYPTYFRWFDAAAWHFFAAAGYTPQRMRESHLAMPLVAAGCEFALPVMQGERCEVRSRILRFGGRSFVLAHEVLREDGRPVARGSETRVWSRHVAGPGSPLKSEGIDEALKARFRAGTE